MKSDESSPRAAPVSNLEFKAGLLLALFVALAVALVIYILYARGAFEETQRLVLVAGDAEGISVGMDITFSGFPIGRVNRIELASDGSTHIEIDVSKKDAHWLRDSSVFTLVRSLVGGASLKAYSGVLTDPPLPDGAERKVLVGDATAELPRIASQASELIQNLAQLTAPDAPLARTLANMQKLTERFNGPHGAVGALLGNDADAKKIGTALSQVNTLLTHIDEMTTKADAQLLGSQGIVPEGNAAVVQLNALLGDTRDTLKKIDGILIDTQAVATNAHTATNDLSALREEVGATVGKVQQLVDEISRKWPFARDTELKLR